MKIALSLLKWIAGYSLLVIGAYAWFTTEIDNRSSAIASGMETKIMAVRDADLKHLDGRFDRLERYQDTRFDKLERIIKEAK